MLITDYPPASKAKLFGAVIDGARRRPVRVVELGDEGVVVRREPTHSGNSSDRKRKSSVRQLAPTGTSRSMRRIVTSRSVSPRTVPPPSFAPELPAARLELIGERGVAGREDRVRRAVGREARQRRARVGDGVRRAVRRRRAFSNDAPVTKPWSVAIAAARSPAVAVGVIAWIPGDWWPGRVQDRAQRPLL